jgi:hypothetical protein
MARTLPFALSLLKGPRIVSLSFDKLRMIGSKPFALSLSKGSVRIRTSTSSVRTGWLLTRI